MYFGRHNCCKRFPVAHHNYYFTLVAMSFHVEFHYHIKALFD